MGIETLSGLYPRKGEQVTAAILAGLQTELVALGQNGQAIYFRPEMIPVAGPGRSSRTWKNLHVTGFALGADAHENRVYTVTAQGLVQRLAPLMAHKQPRNAQAIALLRGDRAAALLSLAS